MCEVLNTINLDYRYESYYSIRARNPTDNYGLDTNSNKLRRNLENNLESDHCLTFLQLVIHEERSLVKDSALRTFHILHKITENGINAGITIFIHEVESSW
jgi:hypothetical protein